MPKPGFHFQIFGSHHDQLVEAVIPLPHFPCIQQPKRGKRQIEIEGADHLRDGGRIGKGFDRPDTYADCAHLKDFIRKRNHRGVTCKPFLLQQAAHHVRGRGGSSRSFHGQFERSSGRGDYLHTRGRLAQLHHQEGVVGDVDPNRANLCSVPPGHGLIES